MTSDTIWLIVRNLLLLSFGPLTAKGYLTSDQATTIVGALGSLFTVAWGVWVKFGTKAVPAATAARNDVPTVSPATGKTS